ncbi:MAG TPA: hypothetical protein VGZ22_29025, partial [Isosphaeraceae bacterium]|nr:hypothetical protein [Isosphaeraceae bacterium]
MRTWLGMTACLLWIPFSPLAPEPASAESIPASIAAEGVPDLPGDLVDQLERYQNSRSASLEGWVGDKREILILTRFGNTSQVHRVAFPGGDRRQLTFLRDRVLGSSPRPHRDQFFYSSDQGGAENFQIFLQDLKSGAVNRLTSGQTRNIAPRWSNSGSLLAYSNNSRNGKDMDIYVADTNEESSPRQLKEVRGHWSVTDWSPDDRRVAAVEMISANESYVHLIN